MVAKHIIFVGRVQGVGFRFTTHSIASRCQLTGFVRNLLDGTVEVLVQGQPADVEQFMQAIQDSFAGYITQTRVEDVPYDSQYTDFKITF